MSDSKTDAAAPAPPPAAAAAAALAAAGGGPGGPALGPDGEPVEVPLESQQLPTSLFEAIQQRQERDGLATRWTRCMIVARVAGKASAVGAHHAALLEAASVNEEGDAFPIHGLGIVQSQSLACIVESTPAACMAYLKAIAAECAAAEDGEGQLEPWAVEDVRVVANSEDCPHTCFGPWAYRDISVAREQDIDLEQENITDAAFNVYSRLTQLGKQMTGKELSEGDLKSALDHLKQYYGEYLPSNERVLALAEQESIFSLEAFLDFHCAPMDLELHSEKVWPIPKSVVEY